LVLAKLLAVKTFEIGGVLPAKDGFTGSISQSNQSKTAMATPTPRAGRNFNVKLNQ
jgi:hypothetical protein